jgi:putative transcriptional regulator
VDSLQGQLLVASPSLLDPNFRRTVVLVTEHGEQGAAGLVLNRPSEAAVEDVVPQLEWLAAPEERVFIGGPVEQNAVLVLAEFEDPEDSPVTVFGDLGFVALDEEDGAAPVRRRRIFAGYAGWGEGQLEEELERDDWILEPALPDDVFADDSDGLWGGVLRRKGGVFELVARMPEDPSVN